MPNKKHYDTTTQYFSNYPVFGGFGHGKPVNFYVPIIAHLKPPSMNIKFHSQFKDPAKDQDYFKTWVKSLETHNGRSYEDITIATSLGKTQVWGLNTQQPGLETLVIFPGARTTALIWDFDRGLDNLQIPLNIYMVETNGLPNLSDGATPDIKSLDFGHWAAEVFEQLGIQQAYVAGASFGAV
jgi:hypothetical protein